MIDRHPLVLRAEQIAANLQPLQQRLTEIDLDAYFQRIGYSGDCSPRLTTLQAIHQKHSQTIAFENLNSLLKQPVKLDLASL